MQQIFIELYNYRPTWAKCSESERTDFAKKVVEAVKGLKSAGVDVVAYGMNSPETDRRARVYRVPNVEFQREFERQVAASGWYEYFEQVTSTSKASSRRGERARRRRGPARLRRAGAARVSLCGVLARGFARFRCDGCRHEILVAFSCKGRGFCPSCCGRRMADLAGHLADHVLGGLPVRQWVLTLPTSPALRARLGPRAMPRRPRDLYPRPFDVRAPPGRASWISSTQPFMPAILHRGSMKLLGQTPPARPPLVRSAEELPL
jgi:Family of unknown function (DUF6616)/Transposase zinc-binding domain